MIEIDIEKKLIGAEGKFNLKFSFSSDKDTFLSIFGKSGSGKTTILRIIAGLEKADRGKIVVNNKVWLDTEKKIDIPPQKRNVGFVFQNYALFPNMTVLENILFAMNKKDVRKALEILKDVELEPLKDRYPNTLSGGQQQRVALARAIARNPEILLLDEPLSALDFSIRFKLQDLIKKLHQKFQLTTILVSHEPQEVIKLSDVVVHIENGKILKVGNPLDIFKNKEVSAKFSFFGYVVDIKKADILYLAVINIGTDIVEVALTEDDIKDIKIGDRVLVASKAFNPIIKKAPLREP